MEHHMQHGSMDAHAQQEQHTSHEHEGGHGDHLTLLRNRFWFTLILTIPLLIYSEQIQVWLGFTPPEFPGSEAVPAVLGTLIFIFGGFLFISMARPEIASRQPGMMTLISLATVSAYTYSIGVFFFAPDEMGFFWELATLIVVMLLGHWLEGRSVSQAQGALKALAKLMPDEAERIMPSGETETVNVSDLRAGDLVLIRPGGSIPADGLVKEGRSTVNESMITGESKPVEKAPDESVIGGTVNQTGSLRVEITRVGDDTALAGIMRLVEEAQRSQSRTQTLAQKAAYWLTFLAIGSASITFVVWILATGDLSMAIRRTVTVLVIACPHALGLAIPLVVAISTALSARNGLLIRKRIALENARLLDVVVFDKTGTLTKGEQGVVTIATDNISADEALRLAAGVEGDSEHIIAQAIRQRAADASLTPASVSDFESLSGRGVRAMVEGAEVYLGGPRLLEHLKLTVPSALADAASEAESAGQSVIYLAKSGAIVAMFALADVIREESYAAIKALHALGIEVAMLTGDSEAVAKHVSEVLGMDAYFAQVLPEHKAEKVRQLQQNGRRVAMVGDGINDAPALATADIGVAIGAGTDVAIESAGIILVKSDPRDIVKIIRLSKGTYRKMVQNLFWAAGYNVLSLPIAMGVLYPLGILPGPAMGAAFMSASTIIVALNAQLLRRVNLVYA